MRFRHVMGALVLAAAASCSLGDTEDAGNINLFISVDDATLAIDEVMTITATAQNVGFEPFSLTGPSNCLLYVEVLDSQRQVVWHSNRPTICDGALVTEEISPGESISQPFTWQGENLAGARLSAGFYHVRPVARVTGAPFVGLTISVAIE